MRDSSDDEEETTVEGGFERAKSPPICGRSRSKSRERKLHKHKVSLSQVKTIFLLLIAISTFNKIFNFEQIFTSHETGLNLRTTIILVAVTGSTPSR